MKTNSRIGNQFTLIDLEINYPKSAVILQSTSSNSDDISQKQIAYFKKPILPEEALNAFFGVA